MPRFATACLATLLWRVDQIIEWTADWIKMGGATLNKPTHFETRDGKF